MRVAEKLFMGLDELIEKGPITIVAFGDSVTHGIFGYESCEFEPIYWNRLRKKLFAIRSYVPINVINAGIGSVTAAGSLGRMDRQVLAHNPDLVIICFGLNDVSKELDEYLGALHEMFDKCLKFGCEVIFMTPNMLNTYVTEDTDPAYIKTATKTAGFQNSGRMDLYMESARALAEEMGVPVCDCYAQWKELSKTQDTTKLLFNHINHPSTEMHELFAESLFRMIMEGVEIPKEYANSSTMHSYEGNSEAQK